MMHSHSVATNKVFSNPEAEQIFGSCIDFQTSGSPKRADIDIIIAAHNYPELTNATINNYLNTQLDNSFHITVVESSGSHRVVQEIIKHPRVTVILIKEDYKITQKIHGYGSYGMALASQLGTYISQSPYLFYSHSDMLSLKKGFLDFPITQLGAYKLISFTQRHLIPFTGCMLLSRKTIDSMSCDWLPQDDNPYTSDWLSAMQNSAISEPHLSAVDCGEAFIYSLISQGHQQHVLDSKGGSQDYWKDPFSYFQTSASKARGIATSFPAINYATTHPSRQEFEKRYAWVLDAAKISWWDRDKRKYWRYSFDHQGDLVFIHHGRGTTRRKVARWLRFAKTVQQTFI